MKGFTNNKGFLTPEQFKGQLEELIDNHHFSPRGLSLVRQGTPTNNTEETGSWFHSNPPPSESLATEREAPLFDEDEAGDQGQGDQQQGGKHFRA